MRGTAKCYETLREYVETVPLVDCHDHTTTTGPKYSDPIQVIANGYFPSDLQSASCDDDLRIIQNSELSVKERWPVLERAWNRTCHTGYAQVTRRVLKRFYGEDKLTLQALERMADKLFDAEDEAAFDAILEEAKIVARLENIGVETEKLADGSYKMAPRGRLVIPLPAYHSIRDYNAVYSLPEHITRHATCLDEYIEACRNIFKLFKDYGAVAFKDQSAYSRTIDYGNPTRADAEEVFNWFMEDPRRSASYPDGVRPLDDYLFHEFMRMARDMDLPVQIHTGHMAGVRNDIAKTNAIGLTRVLELHRDVQFDLFHANWPYSADLLYLGKNYPNVAIDFCWANIIDPIYCQNMFKQALSCVPHGKIHGYGSDYGANVDRAWAHASISRDNIAIALSDLVEIEYLDLDDAKQVAHEWMFDNPNEFFRLGL